MQISLDGNDKKMVSAYILNTSNSVSTGEKPKYLATSPGKWWEINDFILNL